MSTKENILETLLISEDYISGESLALKLGISRNAVWKAIESLRADGFDISAVKNRGYCLNSAGSVLSETVIRKYLTENRFRDIHLLETVDSTNIYAKKIASEGAPHGTLVAAESQTAGKGRLGRSFCSPKGGNIYMSVVLRPKTDMSSSQLITSCIAAAAASAVDKVCGTRTMIKWVNDLFLNGRKLCGILTEASLDFECGILDYAVAGIGINLSSVLDFPEDLLGIVTSVEDETGVLPERSRLIAEILNNIDIYMRDMESRTFLEEYRRRSLVIGRRIIVSKYNEEREAQALGINDDAGLIVRYDDGTEEVLNSGEARLKKL